MLPLGLLPLAQSLLARGALTNGGVCMSGSGDGRVPPVQATLSLHVVFAGAAERLPTQATLQLFLAENPH